MPDLKIQQIVDIEMDVFFSNPYAVFAAMNGAILEGDDDAIRWILAECKKRGVDLAPAINDESDKFKAFTNMRPMTVSSKPFRVPIQTKGN